MADPEFSVHRIGAFPAQLDKVRVKYRKRENTRRVERMIYSIYLWQCTIITILHNFTKVCDYNMYRYEFVEDFNTRRLRLKDRFIEENGRKKPYGSCFHEIQRINSIIICHAVFIFDFDCS